VQGGDVEIGDEASTEHCNLCHIFFFLIVELLNCWIVELLDCWGNRKLFNCLITNESFDGNA
jgi:hypothetical protein